MKRAATIASPGGSESAVPRQQTLAVKHAAAVALLGLGLACSGASAQVVYRCGNAYSQAPCPQATIVDVSDPRDATQQAEGRSITSRQLQRATTLAEARRIREREQMQIRAAGFPSRADRPDDLASTHEARRPGKKHRALPRHNRPGADFIAIVPGSGKKPARPPA